MITSASRLADGQTCGKGSEQIYLLLALLPALILSNEVHLWIIKNLEGLSAALLMGLVSPVDCMTGAFLSAICWNNVAKWEGLGRGSSADVLSALLWECAEVCHVLLEEISPMLSQLWRVIQKGRTRKRRWLPSLLLLLHVCAAFFLSLCVSGFDVWMIHEIGFLLTSRSAGPHSQISTTLHTSQRLVCISLNQSQLSKLGLDILPIIGFRQIGTVDGFTFLTSQIPPSHLIQWVSKHITGIVQKPIHNFYIWQGSFFYLAAEFNNADKNKPTMDRSMKWCQILGPCSTN